MRIRRIELDINMLYEERDTCFVVHSHITRHYRAKTSRVTL